MLVAFQVQTKYDGLRGKSNYLTVHWVYFQQCVFTYAYIYIYIMA